MKTKFVKSGAITSLSALLAVLIAIVYIMANNVLYAFADGNVAVLFDGTSVNATIPDTNTTVEGVTVNIVGMAEMQTISGGFALDGVVYNKAIKTGGKSSTSRYFSFTVPPTLARFVVKVVAAPNGSEAVKFSISDESSVSVNGDGVFFTTGTVNTEYAKGTSQVLTVDSVKTFYLNFSASARIAYVELAPVSDGDQSTVTDSQNGGLSGYSGTSADDGRPKITVSIEDKHDFFSVVQIGLGVLLVILTLVGVVSIVRHNRKKNDFDWTDFDDFDDYC